MAASLLMLKIAVWTRCQYLGVSAGSDSAAFVERIELLPRATLPAADGLDHQVPAVRIAVALYEV
jgi:hypothetical protein